MAFVPTIDPNDALAPDYAGSRKIERWTASALASDSGPATIQARHLPRIDWVEIDAFGGSNPSSILITGSTLLIYLPGTTTATSYGIRLESRY